MSTYTSENDDVSRPRHTRGWEQSIPRSEEDDPAKAAHLAQILERLGIKIGSKSSDLKGIGVLDGKNDCL